MTGSRSTQGRPFRIGVVGFGGAARTFCAPVLARTDAELVIADAGAAGREAAARAFPAATVLDSHHDMVGEVDAAVVATPHTVHAEPTVDLLRGGAHVLVEKPAAADAPTARTMVEAARSAGRVLMVNNCRRSFPSYREVFDRIRSSRSTPVRVTVSDGSKFEWSSASNFYFRDRTARGVLLDRGAHTLDIVHWWLGEPAAEVVDVESDSEGGPEASFRLWARFGPAEVSYHTSRLFRLANAYEVCFDDGSTIAGDLFDWANIRLRSADGVETDVSLPRGKGLVYPDLVGQFIEHFLRVARVGERPLFTAEEVLPSLDTIDRCYQLADARLEATLAAARPVPAVRA